VAEETRARVWQIIEEMNYQPSAIARSLTQQRSLTLGIVTAGLKYVGPSHTLNGITKQAEALGYTLLLKELRDFHANEVQPLLNSLLERRVDGILWAVPEVGDNRSWLEEQLGRLAMPMIFLTMGARPGVSTVAMDNYAGGRIATEHLLQQGCRNIAHLSGPLDWWEARQRKAGWRDALLAAGVPGSHMHAEEGTWSSASGERAIGRLLASYPEMDAVFAGNDQMALSILQVACRRGIKVPQDLAVIGFDGLSEAAHYWPPLTTVYQDLQLLGSTAVQELIRAIDAHRLHSGTFEPRSIILCPQLIVRESSNVSGNAADLVPHSETTIPWETV